MYRIFDNALDSDLPLPELPEMAGPGNVIRVTRGLAKAQPGNPQAWLHEYEDNAGNIAIQCARLSDGYLLRFPGLSDFIIKTDLASIEYVPTAGIPDETVRHLLLDQVVPRVLGQGGRLVLHASSLSIAPDSAIAFVGDSGWGKSTLASSFYEAGYDLLTDDCLLISIDNDNATCIASYAGLRLYSDSADAIFGGDVHDVMPVAHYTEKKRMPCAEQDSNEGCVKAGLAAIFLLNDPVSESQAKSITIEPLSGSIEVMTIIKQMFVLDPTDKELMVQQFRLATSLVESGIPVYCLNYPREHDRLPEVRHAVLEVPGLGRP